MSVTVDFDGQYEVLWDGCDLVIETCVAFYIDLIGEGPNWESFELIVEDKLCEEQIGFAHFQAVNYRFSTTTMEDEDE